MKTVREFADWVNQQPADRSYDFWDSFNCPVAEFGKHAGLISDGQPLGESDELSRLHAEIDDYDLAHMEAPWTYGALAERLEKAIAKQAAA